MKRGRSIAGPFAQRLFFTTSEIDDLCRDALKAAELLPDEPEPIRIERFVEKHFTGALIDYRDLGGDVLGCTTFDSHGAVTSILIADTSQPSGSEERRLRSTIAHEAGHGLMHASLFIDDGLQREFQGTNIDVTQRRILCRPSDIGGARAKPYDGRWWEWQANRAIGGLLLPKRLVHIAVADVAGESPVTGIRSIPAALRRNARNLLADVFDVNPVVADIRLSEMFPSDGEKQMTF